LEEQKQQLEEERQRFTAAAVRLGKERAMFEVRFRHLKKVMTIRLNVNNLRRNNALGIPKIC
jgi:hypothetical protein